MGGGAEQVANEVELQYQYEYGLLIIILQYNGQCNTVQNYYLNK